MGFIEAVTLINKLNEAIEEKEMYIEVLESEIMRITKLVDSLTGLNQKLKYMQLVEGKSLREIAIELNYNYGYIRNIANKK